MRFCKLEGAQVLRRLLILGPSYRVWLILACALIGVVLAFMP